MTCKGALGFGAALLFASSGCQKSAGSEDRTLAKLKAEQAREQAASSAALAPPSPLERDGNSELVTAMQKGEANPVFEPRALPQGLAPLRMGSTTVTLTAASFGRTVVTPKTQLTTVDRFLKVDVQLDSQGKSALLLDLAHWKLRAGREEVEIAPDVQRAAGTHPLTLTLEPGTPLKATLYFEVPPAALAQRLTLLVPNPDGSPANLSF